jgi:hypothetical protein
MHMVYAARARARKDNLPFSITIDDVVIPTHCPVLGIPIIVESGRASWNSPSIDKVVPSNGYVPSNIIVVSRRANLLKNDATPEELRKVADFYGALHHNN